jgi:hypothetical protein
MRALEELMSSQAVNDTLFALSSPGAAASAASGAALVSRWTADGGIFLNYNRAEWPAKRAG